MTPREPRLIVANERQVERLALSGAHAETRASLQRRLLERLAPEVRLATPEETRLVLAESLRGAAEDDVLLGPLATAHAEGQGRRARGAGAAWLGATDALDDAVGTLRAAGANADALARVQALGGATGTRAATLRRAFTALDSGLLAAGLVDGRAAWEHLVKALGAADPEVVAQAVGALHVRARHVLVWETADLAWWRALDDVLRRCGGSATLELPAFEHRLDAERDRDPLEVLVDDVARRSDEAPETRILAARFGDLRLEGSPPSLEGIEVRAAADATAQAHAVVDAIARALSEGVPVENVAIALPRIDEETLVPLRVALDEAKIPFHDSRGPAPTAAPIVAFALRVHRIASRGLPRREVAALLRSRYVDARAIAGVDDAREARGLLHDVARVLEDTPTVAAPDEASALEETVRAGRRGDPEARARVVRALAEILGAVEHAKTRGAHARAARELWQKLGLPGRAGFDARRTLATDEVPDGIARAELRALSRDAHAWEVLMGALEAYETAIERTRLARRPASPEVFRHELERALEAGAPPPGAARALAVRIGRLPEVSGDALACLVVMDVNEGVLPASPPRDALLSEGLLEALRKLDPRRAPAAASVRAARELGALAVASADVPRLVLTTRGRGDDGAALAPAPLAAWLLRGGVATSRWIGTMSGAPLTPRAARLRAILAGRRETIAELVPEAARRAATEALRESWHGRQDVDPKTARESILLGDVSPSHLAELASRTGVRAEDPLPVTSLERFARCAFQGYAAHLLGAKDRTIQGETPDPREHGNLVHDALAAAFAATGPMWRERPRDHEAIHVRALDAADGVFRREAAGSALRRVALDRAREDVVRVLAFSLADETWDFGFAERSFGEARDPETWPPLTLDHGGARLSLRGRIDRVDLAHDDVGSARVIDYKTSKTAGLAATYRDLGRTALQLPLYALAARRALARAFADGVYLPLGDLAPSFRLSPQMQKRWKGLFEKEADAPAPIEARALEVVGRVREGKLAPRPADPGVCAKCSYDGGCRRPRFVAVLEEGGEES